MACISDDYRDVGGDSPETIALLCSACHVLRRMGYDFDENPSLSVWWDKHEKEDDARINRKAEAREFLQQLAEKLEIQARLDSERLAQLKQRAVASLNSEEFAFLSRNLPQLKAK